MERNVEFLPHSLKLCRLCGVYDYLEIDIFDKSPWTGRNFREKVFDCSGVWVSKCDKLTTKMCLRCFDEIKRIDLFRSFCAATDCEIRTESGVQSADDEISSDDDNDDGVDNEPTSSIGLQSDLSVTCATRSFEKPVDSHPSHASDTVNSLVPAVERRERGQCPTEASVPSSIASQKNEILCILLSDDDELDNSGAQIVKNGGQKIMETKMNKNKIKQKCRNIVDHKRCAVKCRARGGCSDRFESVDAMQYHVKTYHANEAERRFSCHLCKQTFKHKQTLQKHLNAVHVGCKSFKCTFADCSKAFTRKDSLRTHTNAIHTQTKPFDCRICRKKFYAKFSFKRHMANKHTRCCCYLCKKTYASKYTLRKHFNLKHVGQSRFTCNVADCSKHYSEKRSLDAHKNAVHTQKIVFNCTECLYGSYYASDLRRHLARKHDKRFPR